MLRNSLLLGLPFAIGLSAASVHADEAHLDGYGRQVFKSANCVGCHKWFGAGGGGYGGAAANLRKTTLDKEQIMETFRCGHPGGCMPYFEENAYVNGTCFGLKESELDAKSVAVAAPRFLSPKEIEAVASYVVANLKGKGDPTFEECQTFFGAATALCNGFPKGNPNVAAAAAPAGDPPAQAAEPAPASGGHLKIETAPDANAAGTQ